MKIDKASVYLDKSGSLSGDTVIKYKKYLSDLDGYFSDKKSYSKLKPDTLLYEVECFMPVSEETKGGLFYGRSKVYPGVVGDEFFMTKGHFHKVSSTAEFYWGISGNGLLLTMDKLGNTKLESVENGSLHYISGNVAHRLINTSNIPLKVGACWHSNAGHDYASIEKNGFGVRILKDPQNKIIIKKEG